MYLYIVHWAIKTKTHSGITSSHFHAYELGQHSANDNSECLPIYPNYNKTTTDNSLPPL